MLNRIARFIAQKQLLDSGKCHIVALSGGADSVALLLIMKRLGYTIEAAHCNFRLRGDESDRDEKFVVSLCKQLCIPIHLIHFDTVTYAESHHVSIEMAARELRYRYFEQLRQDIGAEEVCVAHHRDDAVETLLMNLIRGTGIHGLTGVRPRNGHIVRPLLCVSHAELVSYLDSVGQKYVTDSSNLVPDVVRNKIRLQVLPLLQQINPAASENIAKTAVRMEEAEKVFNKSVELSVKELFNNHAIDIDELLQQPSPEYLLFELLTPYQFTPAQIEQVFYYIKGASGRLFQSPTHEVVLDRGRLIVEERHQPLPQLRIPETGTYRYGESAKFRLEISDNVTVSKELFHVTLDADKVKFPLTVRTVQTGDRFVPFGIKGSRLVSDYLTDVKRSLLQKRRTIVVTDATKEIIWLVGERTDQRFAVDDSTSRVLFISYFLNEK